MQPVGIGVIGCGNISSAYLTAARKFPILNLIALSDANPAAAETRAAEFDLPARSVEALLADPAVEIILNLTIPNAHVDVGLQGDRRRQARPLGKAARRRCRRGAPAGRSRGGQGLAAWLRARHFSRRRPSDCAPRRRRGPDRPPDWRRGVFHVPWPRALASQSGLLLPRGRRPHARHGTLLCHRPGQSPRTGGERQRRRHQNAVRARCYEPAARWRAHSGRGRHACHRNADVRGRSGRHDDDELRRRPPQARADRTLRRSWLAHRSRPQPFRRQGRIARPQPRTGAKSRPRALCRRQLPHPRPCRHGASDPLRAGRIARVENWPSMCSK